ncbi:aldo/keto reductase [Micromonospora humi]|uniref:Predicted oxidoreductase n=1 Tax=Micromonospora humi TaxID=745366 RepID=A0A1C5H9A9_9ACTN|nr:aldo/keto reductase [Micromonospora humi]SCG42477.1 Predicted oxidoreductase [Micromonospora humi]
MQRRQLRDLTCSAIGLGCMGLSQGYGASGADESVATIGRALDLGVTMIDTAQSYGSGHNEELVGRAIAGRRDDVVLATKVGIVREPDGVRLDAHPDRLPAYCGASLRRLGVDVIDLYYLHRVDPRVPLAESVGALAGLVAAGKVRELGVCELGADQLRQAVAVHPIAAVQCEWSLLWREPEDDVLPAARELGVGVVPYSPLGRGMLTGALPAGDFVPGDFRHGDPRFAGPALDHNLVRAGALRRWAEERGLTAGQLALAWLLAQGPDVVPIPGTRSPLRVAENAAAAAVTLSAEDLAWLDREVPRDAWAGDRRSFAAHGLRRGGAG